LELLSQVYIPNLLIAQDLGRRPGGDYLAFTYYIGAAANTQGFPHVVIGDQYADALGTKVVYYILNIDN
jgi:hypothetical protein